MRLEADQQTNLRSLFRMFPAIENSNPILALGAEGLRLARPWWIYPTKTNGSWGTSEFKESSTAHSSPGYNAYKSAIS